MSDPITILKYKRLLSKPFPQKLQSDLNVVLKIIPFTKNHLFLHEDTSSSFETLFSYNKYEVTLDNETLSIPYRIYFDEPKPESEANLSDQLQQILNCIY